jgi:hypothetical protein|eukprot:TRINITY_DN135_c0_g1_i10.p3 TRINITY_DN135_c0_g1~~TRINITY_DN135_c0_g1_i10.p3  ORF type:complete len:105 (-),score=0.69 TRINITY_DN135_c0_g1_i10:1887-2201(-)
MYALYIIKYGSKAIVVHCEQHRLYTARCFRTPKVLLLNMMFRDMSEQLLVVLTKFCMYPAAKQMRCGTAYTGNLMLVLEFVIEFIFRSAKLQWQPTCKKNLNCT